MKVEEFSNEFDTLIDSYRRFKSFDNKEELDSLEFNEYEKSVFLTLAQEDIVKELYNGKNPVGESFESTEEIRKYLNSLVKTSTINKKEEGNIGLSKNSTFFKLPSDVWFITYESVDINDEKLGCMDGKYMDVIPVTLDDYLNIRSNPFRGPNNRKVLRLDAGDYLVELISSYNIDSYLIRYLSKPSPIILIDLPNNITIDNEGKKSECKLNPALHRLILERAVRAAITSKAITGK